MADFVSTTTREDGVAVLRIDRPPMNALSLGLLHELTEVAGERAFAAGFEISEFGDADRARLVTDTFRTAFDAVAAIPRPVIAAVNGFALGGGLELAMACDLRIAGDNARVGQPEVLLGLVPGAGGTQRLPRLVGPARAKELVWSGRQVRADEAERIGLVDRVVPAAELHDAALDWAAGFARGAVAAMGLAKEAIDRGLGVALPDALSIESDLFVDVSTTEDATIGVRSFLENGPGKANFVGR
jgi:enoyl-CoA hydratase/carnithine racemase